MNVIIHCGKLYFIKNLKHFWAYLLFCCYYRLSCCCYVISLIVEFITQMAKKSLKGRKTHQRTKLFVSLQIIILPIIQLLLSYKNTGLHIFNQNFNLQSVNHSNRLLYMERVEPWLEKREQISAKCFNRLLHRCHIF